MTYNEKQATAQFLQCRNSPEHFGSVVDTWTSYVWTVLSRNIGSRGVEVDELCIQVFADLWEARYDYSPEKGSLAGFLAVIARRRASDYLRSRYRRPEPLPLEETDDTADDTALARSMVRQAVDALGEPDRTLVIGKYVVGLSVRELARRMKMTVKAVESRLTRARQKLREALKEQ